MNGPRWSSEPQRGECRNDGCECRVGSDDATSIRRYRPEPKAHSLKTKATE